MLEKGSSSAPDPKRDAAIPTEGFGACPFLNVVVGCGGWSEVVVEAGSVEIAGAGAGVVASTDDSDVDSVTVACAATLSSFGGGELLMLKLCELSTMPRLST